MSPDKRSRLGSRVDAFGLLYLEREWAKLGSFFLVRGDPRIAMVGFMRVVLMLLTITVWKGFEDGLSLGSVFFAVFRAMRRMSAASSEKGGRFVILVVSLVGDENESVSRF